MKNFISLLFVCCCAFCAFAQNGTIYINDSEYPIDTLEFYRVGPGTNYAKTLVTFSPSRKVYLYMLEIDLTNPYTKIEQRNAKGAVGNYAYFTNETADLTWDKHKPIGAVNCNFYWQATSTTDGLIAQPTGGTATNGYLVTNPDYWNMGARNTGVPGWNDMGYVLIDRAGKAIIDNFQWDGKIFINDQSYPICECNRWRNNPSADEIAVFNHYQGVDGFTSRETPYEVVFSCNDWAINKDMTCTVVDVNTTGGTVLKEKEGCLQCRGTGKTFVENLKVGDSFKINLGIYSTNQEGFRPDIMEMTMGNALCMVNGELTQRNTNEDYNTQIYARTGMATNNDGNKLWLLVMETGGMSTTEMCYVFKHAGATFAVGCDGGGSAQLNLLGTVQNRTTTGSPRQVCNSFWAFSTAPDDETIASLAFVDFTRLDISAYATYTPQIRSYNQYDWLLSSDFKDYTLTCEPASLGTISEDGKSFVASAIPGKGKLIAHYGNISAEKTIEVAAGAVAIRLDSVLRDEHDYPIEVFSTANNRTFMVDPKFVSWQVEDEAICSISEKGFLNGLANGETDIYGTLDGLNDTMHVKVEIAESQRLTWNEPFEAQTSNGTYEMADGSLKYTLTSARGAFVQMNQQVPLYSLPDSILVTIKSDCPVSFTVFKIRPNNYETVSIKREDVVPTAESYTYVIPIADIMDATDAAIYPLYLEEIKTTMTSAKSKTEYHYTIEDITLCYPKQTVHLENNNIVKHTNKELRFENGVVYIIKDEKKYSLLGY